MFIPNLNSISGVSCRIGLGFFLLICWNNHVYLTVHSDTHAQVCTTLLNPFHHHHHLVWREVVVYYQVMWWMPMKRHSWFYHPQILVCECRMLLSMFHLHLLIILATSVAMFKMPLMFVMVPLEKGWCRSDWIHVCSSNSFASSFLAKYLLRKGMPNKLYGDSGS